MVVMQPGIGIHKMAASVILSSRLLFSLSLSLNWLLQLSLSLHLLLFSSKLELSMSLQLKMFSLQIMILRASLWRLKGCRSQSSQKLMNRHGLTRNAHLVACGGGGGNGQNNGGGEKNTAR